MTRSLACSAKQLFNPKNQTNRLLVAMQKSKKNVQKIQKFRRKSKKNKRFSIFKNVSSLNLLGKNEKFVIKNPTTKISPISRLEGKLTREISSKLGLCLYKEQPRFGDSATFKSRGPRPELLYDFVKANRKYAGISQDQIIPRTSSSATIINLMKNNNTTNNNLRKKSKKKIISERRHCQKFNQKESYPSGLNQHFNI